MKRLLDEGIWTPEDFERSVSDLNRAMYQECTCAMTTGSQASLLEAEQAGASLHLGLFPFYSSSDNNSDYLFSSPAYYVAASRDLTLPGNEARLAKVLEILEFISTPHGQLDIISQDYPLVSPVRDAIIFNGPFLDTAAATIRKGHLVPMPLFGSMPEGTGDKAVYQALQLFGEGAIDEGTVLEVIDEGVKSEGEDEKAEGGRGID